MKPLDFSVQFLLSQGGSPLRIRTGWVMGWVLICLGLTGCSSLFPNASAQGKAVYTYCTNQANLLYPKQFFPQTVLQEPLGNHPESSSPKASFLVCVSENAVSPTEPKKKHEVTLEGPTATFRSGREEWRCGNKPASQVLGTDLVIKFSGDNNRFNYASFVENCRTDALAKGLFLDGKPGIP